jgi:hypothetical protein
MINRILCSLSQNRDRFFSDFTGALAGKQTAYPRNRAGSICTGAKGIAEERSRTAPEKTASSSVDEGDEPGPSDNVEDQENEDLDRRDILDIQQSFRAARDKAGQGKRRELCRNGKHKHLNDYRPGQELQRVNQSILFHLQNVGTMW